MILLWDTDFMLVWQSRESPLIPIIVYEKKEFLFTQYILSTIKEIITCFKVNNWFIHGDEENQKKAYRTVPE